MHIDAEAKAVGPGDADRHSARRGPLHRLHRRRTADIPLLLHHQATNTTTRCWSKLANKRTAMRIVCKRRPPHGVGVFCASVELWQR